MPPKKASDHTKPLNSNVEANEAKFNWTAQNDRTLLILTFGRNPTPEDFQKFIGALPAGVTLGSIRNRYSRLRMEMKKRYEELGWGVPESVCKKRTTPQKPRTPVTPKKRKGSEGESAEAADDPETPVRAKKLRSKKEGGKKIVVKSEKMTRDQGSSEISSDDGGEGHVFKEENEV